MRITVEGAATRLEGPLLFLKRTLDVGVYDAVEVCGREGRARLGRVAAIDDAYMTIEVLEATAGLSLSGTVVCFHGEPLAFGVGPGILGRVFNGVGQVIDGGPPIAARAHHRIDGLPINPVARAMPRDFIETGITTLDLMNSLAGTGGPWPAVGSGRVSAWAHAGYVRAAVTGLGPWMAFDRW